MRGALTLSGLDIARQDVGPGHARFSLSFVPAEPGPHVIEVMLNWLIADARFGVFYDGAPYNVSQVVLETTIEVLPGEAAAGAVVASDEARTGDVGNRDEGSTQGGDGDGMKDESLQGVEEGGPARAGSNQGVAIGGSARERETQGDAAHHSCLSRQGDARVDAHAYVAGGVHGRQPREMSHPTAANHNNETAVDRRARLTK